MSTMTLSKDATVLAEYRNVLTLLRELSDAEWRTPSRCEGWEVRDVLGHVVGLASDVVGGRIGTFTPDEQAAQRRDATPAELADELEQALGVAEPLLRSLTDEQWSGPSGAPDLTMADGVLTLWYDSWVHRDDVNAAIGRPADEGPGLDAAVSYATRTLGNRGWQAPPGVDVGSLDRHRFVLAATGRTDPAAIGLDESVNMYRDTPHSAPAAGR